MFHQTSKDVASSVWVGITSLEWMMQYFSDPLPLPYPDDGMSLSETRSWLLSRVENSHQLPCTSLRPTWTLLMKLFFCVVNRRGSAQ